MFGIGYVNKPITPCSKELFEEAISSPLVRETCELIKKLVEKKEQTNQKKLIQFCTDRISTAKRTLPCITPMAYFKDNKRSIKNAIPSGLNLIDIDHISDPVSLWDAIKEIQIAYTIALVHITPSTRGLRIIFRQPEGVTIEDAQFNIAKELNVEYDAVTKDLARCSFLVPSSYILYRDDDVLFGDYSAEVIEHTSPSETNDGVSSTNDGSESATKKEKTYSETFKNIPYSEIIKTILYHAGFDELPSEGERNTALYMLARNLRFICDFDVDYIIHVLPDWGLPDKEVRQTVESANKSLRSTMMPKHLQSTVDKMQKLYNKPSENGYESSWDFVVEPEGLIKKIVDMFPREFANAAYLATMACLGTLLTRLRGEGLSGDILKPNFMVCIEAPQASGKSFMKKIYEMVTNPIYEHDKEMRKELREIKRKNKNNKDKDDYEEVEFEGDIRLLPTNTSNRILIERMSLAKYQHLMIMAEEIDSITKAEKTGKWSEKSDIYRLAWDNSRWGMDYANDNSFTETVELYLNLLFSGTPVSVSRFFNDIENGLVTRFLFCFLPDNLGKPRPNKVTTSDEVKDEIKKELQTIYEQMSEKKGEDAGIMMDTSAMNKDILELYEEPQRIDYLCNQADPSRSIVYRRYSAYATIMMMIETWLNNGVYTESIRDRVIGITKYCTEQLISLYGDDINKGYQTAIETNEVARTRSQKINTLDMVDNEFTRRDYEKALSDAGMQINSAGSYLDRLVNGGLIVRVSRGNYKKVL